MFQFFGARLFETENLAAFRIDSGHDVPDGAVLAGSVQCLKNQQQRITVGRVVKLLQRAQLFNVFFQEFLILFLRLAKGLYQRRPFLEIDLFSGRTRKSFELIFIFILLVSQARPAALPSDAAPDGVHPAFVFGAGSFRISRSASSQS